MIRDAENSIEQMMLLYLHTLKYYKLETKHIYFCIILEYTVVRKKRATCVHIHYSRQENWLNSLHLNKFSLKNGCSNAEYVDIDIIFVYILCHKLHI